jgi:hypothetical protein
MRDMTNLISSRKLKNPTSIEEGSSMSSQENQAGRAALAQD